MKSWVADRYQQHITAVNTLMLREIEHWPWRTVEPMRPLIEKQLRRSGKRMRPTIALAVVELLDGTFTRAYPGAAGVEFYHLASLILDDLEDNSEYRHGDKSVHTTAGMSTAINVAALIRSLSYHPIHRSPVLRVAEKAELHRRLDHAATGLLLGQSMDIGWHSGWYESVRSFHYEQMVAWKTGALYEAAASMAALVSGASQARVDDIGSFGARFGVLYQMIDDFRDTFPVAGNDNIQCPQDIAGGKLSYPLVVLSSIIEQQHDPELAASFARNVRLAEHDDSARQWLIAQLAASGACQAARHGIRRQAARIMDDLRTWGLGLSRISPLTELVSRSAALADESPGAIADYDRCQESW